MLVPPATCPASRRPGTSTGSANRGTGVAISLHVYGADISRLGSSVRRVYHLPVRPAPDGR